MKLSVALRLARISLLPTIGTNVLAGVVLAGGSAADPRILWAMLAMALAYTGGMFLNDAFDRDFDARTRPDRPIPAGEVSARTVFGHGFGMLAASILLLAAVGVAASPVRVAPALAGLVLALVIVGYDAWHKQNPLSPLVMGSCRMLVYVVAAATVTGTVTATVWLGAAVLLCYLIGLTYAAKNEHLATVGNAWPLLLLAAPAAYALWRVPTQPAVLLPLAIGIGCAVAAVLRLIRRRPGDVPEAVGLLLAGIAVVDAIILAGEGAFVLTLVALAAAAFTLRLQRWVRGT